MSFFIFSLLFLFSCPVSASKLMEDLFESAELSRLEEILPADLPLRQELLQGVKSEGGISRGSFFQSLFQSGLILVRDTLFSEIRLFVSLFCILILSAFFSSMRQAWFRDSVGDAVDFLSVLLLALTAFSSLYSLFVSVRDVLLAMSGFLGAMLPITTAVYTLSGGVVTATVHSSLFLTALSVLDALCTSYLLPLFSAVFALSAANAVSAVDLSSLARFLRRTVSLCLSVLFLVLLVILGIQTTLSASADSLSLRSARFAAASFIPAVGGFFSESAKTVFSALAVLRSSVGAVGVFVILWLVLAPLLLTFVRRMVFSLLSAFASCFALEREGGFFADCAETLGLLSAILLSCSVFFLLGFGVLMSVSLGG